MAAKARRPGDEAELVRLADRLAFFFVVFFEPAADALREAAGAALRTVVRVAGRVTVDAVAGRVVVAGRTGAALRGAAL